MAASRKTTTGGTSDCRLLPINMHDASSYSSAPAFRSELVSQNPDDEPASVLLHRVRAKKDKKEMKGGGI